MCTRSAGSARKPLVPKHHVLEKYYRDCGDVVFSVKDMAGGPEGQIRKIFTCGELCGLNNKFKVVYPPGAPQGDKALVLGATMLLDLQYFEQNKNN